MVLKIYTGSSSLSCRKAIQWCKDSGIEFLEIRLGVQSLTQGELLRMLMFTNRGLDEFLAKTCYPGQFDNLKLHEALDVLITEPEWLKKPILFDGKRLVIGYNVDNIRCFIPKNQRQILGLL